MPALAEAVAASSAATAAGTSSITLSHSLTVDEGLSQSTKALLDAARDQLADELGAPRVGTVATVQRDYPASSRRQVQSGGMGNSAPGTLDMTIVYIVGCTTNCKYGTKVCCADVNKKVKKVGEQHMSNIIKAITRTACQQSKVYCGVSVVKSSPKEMLASYRALPPANVDISKALAQLGTSKPTGYPTTDSPTAAPTTKAPTRASSGKKSAFKDGTILSAGSSTLAFSVRYELVTLSRLSSSTGAATPAGRSYDGYAWEGVAPTALNFSCPSTSCTVQLPGSDKYRVNTFTVPQEFRNKTAARFLLQATWGPKISEVRALAAGNDIARSISKWIKDQFAMPAELHRTHWRKRINGRKLKGSYNSAPADSPCDAGSRWHSYAFNTYDVGKTIAVSTKVVGGKKKYVLSIDGVARTEMDKFNLSSSAAPYKICGFGPMVCAANGRQCALRNRNEFGRLIENAGTSISVGSNCKKPVELLNPTIQFSSPPTGISQVFGSGDVVLAPVQSEPNASVITAFRVRCKLPKTLPPKTGNYYTKDDHMSVAFMTYRGQYYRHDPRVRLLRNTLKAPANDSVASASSKCPTVARNFINGPTCKRQHACSPVSFGSSIFQLNATVLRQFFTTETKCAAHAFYNRTRSRVAQVCIDGCSIQVASCRTRRSSTHLFCELLLVRVC